jgi:transcriptional regulator with PAS, ATPase and Fis domain
MLYKKNRTDSNDVSERDILYKVLFDMKQDVMELKKLVFQLMSSDQDEQLLQKHKGLFKNIQEDGDGPTYVLNNDEPSDPTFDVNEGESDNDDDDIIEDITHETEDDDSLSIEKKEKELIIKALYKNNNKRKYAAQDLGISERTLYRKIKQYQIDE